MLRTAIVALGIALVAAPLPALCDHTCAEPTPVEAAEDCGHGSDPATPVTPAPAAPCEHCVLAEPAERVEPPSLPEHPRVAPAERPSGLAIARPVSSSPRPASEPAGTRSPYPQHNPPLRT